ILGLIAPGIADLGKSAGRLLFITSLLAYGFTIFPGLFCYFSGKIFLPGMLSSDGTPQLETAVKTLEPYFTLEMPPVFDVMTALILSFTLGLGIAFIKG